MAWAAEASLGDATWSVSTGLGACLAAAVYEVPFTGSHGYVLGATLNFVCRSCEVHMIGVVFKQAALTVRSRYCALI